MKDTDLTLEKPSARKRYDKDKLYNYYENNALQIKCITDKNDNSEVEGIPFDKWQGVERGMWYRMEGQSHKVENKEIGVKVLQRPPRVSS